MQAWKYHFDTIVCAEEDRTVRLSLHFIYGDETMELDLTVDVTTEDYRAFIRFAQEQGKKAMSKGGGTVRIKFLNLLFWIGMGLVLTVLANMSGNPIHLPSAIGSAVVVFAVFFTLVWWHSKKLQDHMLPEPGRAIVGRHIYQFRDTDISIVSPHAVSRFSWAGIMALEETPTHLFLMVDRCAGCIFPKRAFSGGPQITQFKTLVAERIERGFV